MVCNAYPGLGDLRRYICTWGLEPQMSLFEGDACVGLVILVYSKHPEQGDVHRCIEIKVSIS